MNHLKFVLILSFFLCKSQFIYAQTDSTKFYTIKPRLGGIIFGVNTLDYYRNSNQKYRLLLEKPHYGYNGGVIIDIFKLKRLESNFDLSYVLKGNKEQYQSVDYNLIVDSRLGYIQLNLQPVIIKPFGFRKFNPYFGPSLFISRQVFKRIEYSINREINSVPFTDPPTNLDTPVAKTDRGLGLIAGIQISYFSLQCKYENGRNPIFENKNIKNQNVYLSIKLTH